MLDTSSGLDQLTSPEKYMTKKRMRRNNKSSSSSQQLPRMWVEVPMQLLIVTRIVMDNLLVRMQKKDTMRVEGKIRAMSGRYWSPLIWTKDR